MHEEITVDQHTYVLCTAPAHAALREANLDAEEVTRQHWAGLWDRYPGCTTEGTVNGVPDFRLSRCALGAEQFVLVGEHASLTIMCVPQEFVAFFPPPESRG
jgi:hypothetical protein